MFSSCFDFEVCDAADDDGVQAKYGVKIEEDLGGGMLYFIVRWRAFSDGLHK